MTSSIFAAAFIASHRALPTTARRSTGDDASDGEATRGSGKTFEPGDD